MAHKRREKDKLPKDVSNLTGDQVMEKVFSKKAVEKMKEVAHEHDKTDSGSDNES